MNVVILSRLETVSCRDCCTALEEIRQREVDSLDSLFSKVAQALQPSPIRELKKRIQGEDVISLIGGEPSSEVIPKDEIHDLLNKISSDISGDMLGYGLTKGKLELREKACNILSKKGITSTLENIILTNGSQRALDLVGRVLIDPGDVVFIEAPTYSGAIACFRNLGAELVPVDIDDNGLNVDALKRAISNGRAAGKQLKLLYTIPNFQNPSGCILPLERRKDLALIAERENIFILEDDPYGDLWFTKDSMPPQPIVSHCKGNCLYLGGFSEIIAPGLRTAYLYGPEEIIDVVENIAQASDLSAGSLDQMLILELLNAGVVDRAMASARIHYRDLSLAMLASLEEFMPEDVSWSKPGGGFFIWLKLPGNIDTEILLDSAVGRGVAFVPGSYFYPDKNGHNFLRLSFSGQSKGKIRLAVANLGTAIRFWDMKNKIPWALGDCCR